MSILWYYTIVKCWCCLLFPTEHFSRRCESWNVKKWFKCCDNRCDCMMNLQLGAYLIPQSFSLNFTMIWLDFNYLNEQHNDDAKSFKCCVNCKACQLKLSARACKIKDDEGAFCVRHILHYVRASNFCWHDIDFTPQKLHKLSHRAILMCSVLKILETMLLMRAYPFCVWQRWKCVTQTVTHVITEVWDYEGDYFKGKKCDVIPYRLC